MTDLALSVVVIGYLDELTVVDAVASLLGQRTADAVEVILVTSGGDRSAELVRRRFPHVTVHDAPLRLLPGGARNVGTSMAKGQYLAFLAADCIAEPEWVAARLAAHRAGHPVVAAAVTTSESRRPSTWAYRYLLFCGRLPGRPEGPVSHGDPAGHGMSFARSVLDRLGPFDDTVLLGEDTEMVGRLHRLGIRVWFTPAVRGTHRAPSGTLGLLAEMCRRGGQLYRTVGRSVADTSPTGATKFVLALWWILRTSWSYDRQGRWRIVVSFPWIMLGLLADVAGYEFARRRDRKPAIQSNKTTMPGSSQ